MIEAFLARWGYIAVGTGALIEGETVLLAGGAFAHRGLLSLPLVIAAAFVGSVIGDQFWFQLGRRYGRPYLDRKPALRKRADALEPWLRRFGDGFVFGFRFAYGLRTITPVLLGANGYPVVRFTLINMLGAAVWSAAICVLGWAVGAGLATALARAGRVEEILAAALVVTSGLFVLRRGLANRARRAACLDT